MRSEKVGMGVGGGWEWRTRLRGGVDVGCGSEKDGGPATRRRRRRRERQGCAKCLRGMAGIKDGLGVLTSVLVSDRIQYVENDDS